MTEEQKEALREKRIAFLKDLALKTVEKDALLAWAFSLIGILVMNGQLREFLKAHEGYVKEQCLQRYMLKQEEEARKN